MSTPWQDYCSFSFSGVDMYDTYGLQCYDVLSDVLKPKTRANYITIPHRNGVVDFGGKWYDQRRITVRCMATYDLTRAQVREIAYTLSKKARLYLFTEPEKYYIAQLYEAAGLNYEINKYWQFDLNFLCDPFAYGAQQTQQFKNSKSFTYAGTAQTPTVITIENTNDYPIQGITIQMRETVE